MRRPELGRRRAVVQHRKLLGKRPGCLVCAARVITDLKRGREETKKARNMDLRIVYRLVTVDGDDLETS